MAAVSKKTAHSVRSSPEDKNRRLPLSLPRCVRLPQSPGLIHAVICALPHRKSRFSCVLASSQPGSNSSYQISDIRECIEGAENRTWTTEPDRNRAFAVQKPAAAQCHAQSHDVATIRRRSELVFCRDRREKTRGGAISSKKRQFRFAQAKHSD